MSKRKRRRKRPRARARGGKKALQRRVMEKADLTDEELQVWRAFWDRLMEVTTEAEHQAELAYILQVDSLTAETGQHLDDFATGQAMSRKSRGRAKRLLVEAQSAWANLDEETRALIESKRAKEAAIFAELDRAHGGEGQRLFQRARQKVTRVLQGLTDDERVLLEIHHPQGWAALSRE